jgi:hypothetical protein
LHIWAEYVAKGTERPAPFREPEAAPILVFFDTGRDKDGRTVEEAAGVSVAAAIQEQAVSMNGTLWFRNAQKLLLRRRRRRSADGDELWNARILTGDGRRA